MQENIILFLDQFGYLGIFLLIFIENLFPPIPSEVVLLFGGALTLETTMNAPLVILFATLGSLAGAILLYGLGRKLKAERLKKLFSSKFGKVLHLKPEYIDRSTAWFSKYQTKAVFLCRCVPLVRSLISIPAGCNEMNIPEFLTFTAFGSAIWNTVLVLAGVLLGDAWEAMLPHFKQYSALLVIGCILVVSGIVLWKQYRKNRGTKQP